MLNIIDCGVGFRYPQNGVWCVLQKVHPWCNRGQSFLSVSDCCIIYFAAWMQIVTSHQPQCVSAIWMALCRNSLYYHVLVHWRLSH